jgi:hypothetical protein
MSGVRKREEEGRFTEPLIMVWCLVALWGFCIISGCTITIPPAVIDAITNAPPAAITNAMPTTKPATTSCGCDLTKPATVFASPVHGQDEAAVGAWLRQRWVDGKRDSCDGLPRDVRPQALNPSGRGPYNWKWAILGGGVRIEFNDKGEMRAICGDVPVDGQVQRWHVAGCTNTEEGKKAADWTPMEPGVWVKQKHFVCFEIRNK